MLEALGGKWGQARLISFKSLEREWMGDSGAQGGCRKMLGSGERGVLYREDSGALGVSGDKEKSLIKKQGLARGEVSLTSMPESQEAIRVDAEVKVGLGRDFYWSTRPYVELTGTG